MATLIFKMAKDKGIFHNRSHAEHKGSEMNLDAQTQREAMTLVIKKMNELANELKQKGYDHQTIKFSIKTK